MSRSTSLVYLLQVNQDFSKNDPIFNLHGKLSSGDNVLVRVSGFNPYIYMRPLYKNHLVLTAQLLQGIADVRVKACTKEICFPFVGYQHQPSEFTRVDLSKPNEVNMLVRAADSSGHLLEHELCECNVNFVVRFLVDTKISVCTWLIIHSKSENISMDHKKNKTITVNTSYREIGPSEEQPPPPFSQLKILYFDIECAGRSDPLHDPVITICSSLVCGEVRKDKAFVLHTVDEETKKKASFEILEFKNETDLLTTWCNYLNCYDPEIISGYNILGFDFPYLFKRADHLQISSDIKFIGRSGFAKCRERSFSNKACGQERGYTIDIPGRIVHDVLQAIKRSSLRLRSYALGAVGEEVLKEGKEDVSYEQIDPLFRSGPRGEGNWLHIV